MQSVHLEKFGFSCISIIRLIICTNFIKKDSHLVLLCLTSISFIGTLICVFIELEFLFPAIV